MSDKTPKMKNIQVYAWYPVEGGCPKCRGSINIQTGEGQVLGIRNFELTVCPHPKCGASLEVFIAEKRKGKYEMVDLKSLPHKARPKAHVMRARIAEGKVLDINQAMMGQGGDA